LDNKRRLTILLLLGIAASGVQAAGTMETPLLDPWVPPALRKHRIVEPASEGPALRAQVERKLRSAFEDAAKAHGGTFTREQARASGFGFIAEHFAAIDRRGAGIVRFEDYKRFLRERGAALE
jgi:hypothetical protein